MGKFSDLKPIKNTRFSPFEKHLPQPPKRTECYIRKLKEKKHYKTNVLIIFATSEILATKER
jgi:hypothetical protein